MNDYVSKPIDRQELLVTIDRWVAADRLPHNGRNATATDESTDGSAEVDSFKEPEMLPAIDVDDALRRVGGNESLLIRVLSIFLQTYRDIIPEIRTALEGGNTEEARRKVHTLKGVAGSLSAGAVFEATRNLESAIRNGEETVGEELLLELDSHLNALRAFAQEVERSQSLHPSAPAVPDSGPQEVPDGLPASDPVGADGRVRPDGPGKRDTGPLATTAQLARLLNQLLRFVREYDPVGSENTLASVATALSGQGQDLRLKTIAGRLRDYDFQGAIPEVEELAREMGILRTS